MLSNFLTRYEIHGKEHLLAALERKQRTGHGIITISNHQSLFDVPMFGAVAAGGETASGGGFGDIIQFNAGLALLFGGRPAGSAAPPSAPPANTME